jgi:perosamine synthetase
MLAKRYRVPWGTRGSILDDTEASVLGNLVCDGSPLSMGQWRDRFEKAFAEMVGSKYAFTVTSGTTALGIAMQLLDLEAGDEVIATPQTFQATVHPLLDYTGVRVRFCDILPSTLNVDPASIEALVGPRTRALLLVHYGGFPAEMDQINALAQRHGFLVLEDCAHALGARYRQRVPGSLADIGCFSFHSSKNITTLGEGGMITFDRDDWAERVERLRSNEVDAVVQPRGGKTMGPPALPWMKYSGSVYRDTVQRVRHSGLNATMSEAAAAVGLVQMNRLETQTELRRSIAARLDEVLMRYSFIEPQLVPPYSVHARHLYTCFAQEREVRDELLQSLDRRDVEIQLRYFPQHLLPEWRHLGHRHGECPVAESVWFEQHLNLPCHPGLGPSQLDYLTQTLDASLAELSGTAQPPPARSVQPVARCVP